MIEINQIVNHDVQLKQVVLSKVEAELNEDLTVHGISIKIKSWGKVISSKKGETYLNIQLGEKDITPLYLNVIQKGICESQVELDEHEFETFLEVQGMRLIWSFARQSLYDLTSKMGVKPYILPTIDVLKTIQNNQSGNDVNGNM